MPFFIELIKEMCSFVGQKNEHNISMKILKKKLKALTLTELMVVLVIIGILILLALPNMKGLFGQAYSLEAKKQLKFLHSLQEGYHAMNFRYSDDFKQLRFEPPKVKANGGDAVYDYEIVNASKQSFLARATATEDFDGDGELNVWEINQDGQLQEVTLD